MDDQPHDAARAGDGHDPDPDRGSFIEVDPERFEVALRGALAALTPTERLLGKVDEDGDVIWGGCPRAMFKPESVPWIDRFCEKPD